MKLKFRYDISFLRVLSVFAVLLYHFEFSYFKGGFIGVDIFFVISGFLMTKIILQGLEKDSFKLFEFYSKRVIRIFPALLSMVVFFALVVYILIPTQFIVYLKSAFSSTLFFSNIYYYLNNGYFDQTSKRNFLLHTWSLSVEWQFYLLLPLLLLILKNVYTKNIIQFRKVFISITIISFLSMLYHNQNDDSFSFYIFYTRAWEMLFGGLAFLYTENFKKISSRIKVTTLLLSYFSIVLLITKEVPLHWPTYVTIFPVTATFFILVINHDFSFYKNKIIKYLGDISYSLYLYHWPLYVISLFFALNERLRYRIIFILISLLLSILSYEFVEKRNYQHKTKYILITAFIIFISSLYISSLHSNPFFKKAVDLGYVTANYATTTTANKQFNFKIKHLGNEKDLQNFDKKFLSIPNNGKKTIVLLGDSHAGMFAHTFENISRENDYNLIQITADGTYPMMNSPSQIKSSTKYFNYIFKDYFPKNYRKIDLVIISSNYSAYPKNELNTKINYTEKYFKNYNISEIYLGQTNNYIFDFPTYYFMTNNYGINYLKNDEINKNVNDINYFMKNRLSSSYVDILNIKIKKVDNNQPYICDLNHLTYFGSEQYRKEISKAIKQALNNNLNIHKSKETF